MFRIIIYAIFLTTLASCSNTFLNKNPINQPFPNVIGNTLSGIKTKIPADLGKQPSVLLIGFVRKTQFDIDRWLIGLDQTSVNTNIYEVPAINSFWASLFQERIDDGMRSGIPNDLWNIVITVYEDGKQIQQFTGNERPRNARVVLLDSEGTVRFFHDQGFSVKALNQLRDAIKQLSVSTTETKL